MNSGFLKISVPSWMFNLSIYFECVLVLTYVSFSVKILLKVWVYVGGSYYGSLTSDWRTTDSNGSDNRACLSSKVYGFS